MPFGRIRASVRKSGQKAHEGAGAFSKEKEKGEIFVVSRGAFPGGAEPSAKGFLGGKAFREDSHGHNRVRAEGREGLPVSRDRLLRWHADRVDDRDVAERQAGERHAPQGTQHSPHGDSLHRPFRSWMPLPMARLDRSDEGIRIRAFHVQKGLLAGQFGLRRILRHDQKRDVLQRWPIDYDGQGIHPISGRIPDMVQGKENQGIVGFHKHG